MQAKHLPRAEEDNRDPHQDHEDPDRQSPGHVGRKRRSHYPADDQADNNRPEFEADRHHERRRDSHGYEKLSGVRRPYG
jgi:hypothetical protein